MNGVVARPFAFAEPHVDATAGALLVSTPVAGVERGDFFCTFAFVGTGAAGENVVGSDEIARGLANGITLVSGANTGAGFAGIALPRS